jgi:linoleoyl-CoA desaturase
VFQLAHCVEEADFPRVTAGTHSIDNAWAIHQVQTTINFSRGNRALTWLLGGLNYQIEHHLFPEVSHCHYPAVAVIVKQACADFGVRYQEHDSFWSGVCSHIRWLKRMGAAAPAATAVGLPA